MKIIYRIQLNREPFEMMYFLEYQGKYYMAILDNPDDKWNDNQEWEEVLLDIENDTDILWYKSKKKDKIIGNIITIKK